MQLLASNQILQISGGDKSSKSFGLSSANWATVFGLSSKAFADAMMSQTLISHEVSTAYVKAISMTTSSAVGLFVGFFTYNTIEAAFAEE